MSKALVISGGGAKGAYAVGFLNHLNDNAPSQIDFKTYVGTSTGALIAPFMALGPDQLPNLMQIYSTTKDKDVLAQRDLRGIQNKPSIFHTEPLRKLIDNWLSDFDCQKIIDDSTKEVHLLATCLQSKRLTVFTTSATLRSNVYDVIRITTPKVLKAAMLASANQPIIMPPIQVNRDLPGGPLRALQYVDGGLVEYVGTEIAMNSNADKILTILLSNKDQKIDTETFKSILKIAGTTLSIFTEDVGRNDVRIPMLINDGLSYLHQIREGLRNKGVSNQVINDVFAQATTENFRRNKPFDITIIRPSEILFGGIEALKFIPKNMKKMIALGEKDAKKYLEDLTRGGGTGPVA